MKFSNHEKMSDNASVQVDGVKYLEDAINIQFIENKTLAVVHKDRFYALKLVKNDSIIGWVELAPKTVNDVEYMSVFGIYIVPKYRKTKALFILLNTVKHVIKQPIIVDGPVFQDGVELLNALSTRPEYATASFLDKRTGDKTPYSANKIPPVDIESNYAVVLESCVGIPLEWDSHLPGSPGTMMYFQHLTEQELQDIVS